MVHAVLSVVRELVQIEHQLPSSLRTFKQPIDWIKEFTMLVWKHKTVSPVPDDVRVSARTMWPVEALYKRLMAYYVRSTEHGPYIERNTEDSQLWSGTMKDHFDYFVFYERKQLFFERTIDASHSGFKSMPPDYQWLLLVAFTRRVMNDRNIFPTGHTIEID